VFSAAAGFRGILLNMNLLHRMMVRFLSRGERVSEDVWGEEVPRVEKWQPSVHGLA
jgi:hypothetical protein